MRFENLSFEKKIQFLHQLHYLLNEKFYNNQLNDICIDIENINKYRNTFVDAVFRLDRVSKYLADAPDTDEELRESSKYRSIRIVFSHELEDRLELCNTEKDQLYILCLTMLHQMIYQFCFEKLSIQPTQPAALSEKFWNIACNHGIGFDNEYMKYGLDEILLPESEAIIQTMTIS